ncbi:UbiD family decarboxylase [Halopiger aswanensis]|uniref:4-hydroxy-3-polyprenylbenzoate decarboxylase n=1 Tax=Halopiger aswanensis TaxID=148449 RepID=A0A419W1F6_9EURY|nr:UbiD family decarboxylase domain-containing protein [Halopiger aswanensis]RKD89312.1 4-hydroxy-3-polyprenylbenzoate decarboxylase [Halopiger aswanensis]
MISFAQYLQGLAGNGDLVTLEEPIDVPLDVVAAEALRASGPALRYDRTDGVDLASGTLAGPDQMQRRKSRPWSRLALGLGLDPEASFVSVLETITSLGPSAGEAEPTYARQAASRTVDSVQKLHLPQGTDDVWPSLTLGVASVSTDEGSHWAPIHGSVIGDDKLRVRTPAALSSLLADDGTLSIALGVPAAAVAAAYLLAVTEGIEVPVQDCGVADDVPLVPTNGGLVPSATELIVETTVADRHPDFQSDRREAWEHGVSSTPLSLSVERVIATDDPVIPFSPVGRPLADDLQLTGLATAATLYRRVNDYWGISPVEWVLLPAEAELGICFVATDVLYAGFEWQLANLLFAFSSLFDTVVIVDEDVSPRELGRVLGDIWVKAHPSRDWIFSESSAPAAKRPRYRKDGTTGARLYVNAAWDPRWEDSYIAPRVSFEQSFPTSVRDAAREVWNDRHDAASVDRDRSGF